MNRLQKKCFIASAGFHLLLALILLVGPAFLASKEPPPDKLELLDFVPLKTVDALMSGGGNPNAKSAAATFVQPPQPQPPAPQPKQQQEPAPEPEVKKPAREPDPPKTVLKETKPDESLEINEKPKRKIELKPIVRDTGAEKVKAEKAKAAARQKEADAARREALNQIQSVASLVGNTLTAGGTSVELKGPGGGGIPYANFLQALKSVYARAWNVPDGVTDDAATATVSVTIARDGTVVAHRITRASGNADVDRSVQSTLDRVKHAVPLPDSEKSDERTVSINFNVRAKRALG